jgi:hypothetical protein
VTMISCTASIGRPIDPVYNLTKQFAKYKRKEKRGENRKKKKRRRKKERKRRNPNRKKQSENVRGDNLTFF